MFVVKEFVFQKIKIKTLCIVIMRYFPERINKPFNIATDTPPPNLCTLKQIC